MDWTLLKQGYDRYWKDSRKASIEKKAPVLTKMGQAFGPGNSDGSASAQHDKCITVIQPARVRQLWLRHMVQSECLNLIHSISMSLKVWNLDLSHKEHFLSLFQDT